MTPVLWLNVWMALIIAAVVLVLVFSDYHTVPLDDD